jgi:hypothetical protein
MYRVAILVSHPIKYHEQHHGAQGRGGAVCIVKNPSCTRKPFVSLILNLDENNTTRIEQLR